MRVLETNVHFRRLFLGRLVTNVGDSLYYVAAMWLVFDITGSTFYTGLAAFLTVFPQALQFLAGPLVDRWSVRNVLVRTQLAQAALVSLVPLAAWQGRLSVWLVLFVMPVVSMLNQFAYPAQSAAIPRLVERERLVEANSAISLAYQGTQLAFNGLAGVLVVLVGAVALYALDAITFLLAAGLFFALRVPSAAETPDGDLVGDAEGTTVGRESAEPVPDGSARTALAGYCADLGVGLGYLRRSVLSKILGAGVVANFLLGATVAVLPAFAAARGGPELYGLLMAAIAGGGLVGALTASRFDHVGYGRLSMGGFALGGALWLAAVAVPWTPATVALFCLAFVPVGITNVVAAAFIQSMVPADLLGRVSAAVTSVVTVMYPVGSLLGGAVAESVGPTAVVASAGGGFLFIVVYVAAIPSVRRLPPVVEVETVAAPAAD